MNVFDCAIKIEEEAKQYYEQLGSESNLPEMKNLFTMLAASEEEHRNSLLQLKKSMPADKAQVDGLDGTVCRFRPLLTKRELMEEVQNDPDFYKLTMREEEQEIKLYEELAMRAKDETTRTTLLKLAEAERKHLNTVANIYDFVESPRTYLAYAEFSNLHDL